MRRKAGAIATLALVCAAGPWAAVVCQDIPGASIAGEPVGVGTPLAMKFTALDGREVDTEKMLGKVILVHFWAT
jgi:hypothetical protein